MTPRCWRPSLRSLGRPFGHLVVTMREPRKASLVMRDLCQNIFVMHGTPRPVDASVARPGAPLGSQRMYDEAVKQAFGGEAGHKPTIQGGGAAPEGSDRGVSGLAASSQKLALIEIPQPAAGTRPATLDERAALKLRRMLARGEAERAELWHQDLESKRQLHDLIEQQYNIEKKKFEMVQKLNSEPIVQILNGGRVKYGKQARIPQRNTRAR